MMPNSNVNERRDSQTSENALDPEHWVDRYGDFLYRYALMRLRDPDEAEEAVQETLLGAFKNRHQFAGRTDERGWLTGILKMKVIDRLRARMKKAQNLDDDRSGLDDRLFDEKGRWRQEVRQALTGNLDSVDRQEFWEILNRCLDELPPRQSAVFSMRAIEDESPDAVCKELGISPTNFWVMMHRARTRLSHCMTQRWFLEQSSEAST